MSGTSRLFFALWPDDQTRQVLARLSQSITAKGFKWIQPYNLHVTLVFLGQVNKNVELSIKQSIDGITAQLFELTFDSLSYWSKPKILCLTCQQPVPEAASMLVAGLETAAANCGLQTDTRPYTPHITLARHARYLPDVKIEPIIWRADSFCLVESCSEPDGVCYKVIQQWPLIKPIANPG
ncbi:RNA 2',3'-cyclic phosphodiesterase [Methylobacter sp.]|uniref:RNA 2',3'-cyclic phosphodiesterase n=1 Tax=Methylobacter sp. TaxID=2051955 RepID=UPI0012086254|nr:RNA 2',3'-cyclic phosphodiesterase [Methylobacter sp.]TAK63691.1 MAG: RNA 2',3'-cyclic phosphodiesterase [Methylobacter sp.]